MRELKITFINQKENPELFAKYKKNGLLCNNGNTIPLIIEFDGVPQYNLKKFDLHLDNDWNLTYSIEKYFLDD